MEIKYISGKLYLKSGHVVDFKLELLDEKDTIESLEDQIIFSVYNATSENGIVIRSNVFKWAYSGVIGVSLN